MACNTLNLPFINILAALAKSDMHIQGQIECGTQYHFTMETQTALVVPGEGDTYAVYSSTQWTGFVQAAVSNILGIPSSRYVVHHNYIFGVGANELKCGRERLHANRQYSFY